MGKFDNFVNKVSVGQYSQIRTLALELDNDIDRHGGNECAMKAVEEARNNNIRDFKSVIGEVLGEWRKAVDGNDVEALERLKRVFKDAGMANVYREAMAGLSISTETSTTESSRQLQKPQEAAPTEPKVTKQGRLEDAPVSDTTSSGSYKLGTYEIKGKLGKALIIKNEILTEDKKVDIAKIDVENITTMLLTIGIDRNDIHDYSIAAETPDKIEKYVKMFAQSASDYSYVCCFVTSHGDSGTISEGHNTESYFFAKDRQYMTITQLKSFFTTSQLRGIPKLFFINSCRGGMDDTTLGPESAPPPRQQTKIDPIESDVFIFHATPLGYVARADGSGSYFVNKVRDVLRSNFQTSDLMEIATIVNEELAQEFKKKFGVTNLTQMSVMESTLRKRFYFIEESKIHK